MTERLIFQCTVPFISIWTTCIGWMNELQEQWSSSFLFCFVLFSGTVSCSAMVLWVLSSRDVNSSSRRIKFSCLYIRSTQVVVVLWLTGLHRRRWWGGGGQIGAVWSQVQQLWSCNPVSTEREQTPHQLLSVFILSTRTYALCQTYSQLFLENVTPKARRTPAVSLLLCKHPVTLHPCSATRTQRGFVAAPRGHLLIRPLCPTSCWTHRAGGLEGLASPAGRLSVTLVSRSSRCHSLLSNPLGSAFRWEPLSLPKSCPPPGASARHLRKRCSMVKHSIGI